MKAKAKPQTKPAGSSVKYPKIKMGPKNPGMVGLAGTMPKKSKRR